MITCPLGAVIAGGRSTRYGSPKALAEVAGVRIVDRVIAALRDAVDDIVLIANDDVLASQVPLPVRSDVIADLGALGGIHAALHWARERELRGIIAVACDMPFLSAPLVRHLVACATDGQGVDVVAPESDGPRGLEPLCAWYGAGCLDAIERAVGRGDRRMIGFHDDVRVATLGLDVVRAFGDPAVMFMNVNTPEDRENAERIAGGNG